MVPVFLGQQLNGHVVGTGRVVVSDTAQSGVGVSPGDDSVDQSVAPACDKVVGSETES
jgi:hypothetical protein